MNPDLKNNLAEYDIHSSSDYYSHAFSRNIGLLTQPEQEKLRKARIAIPGMGGVGGVHLICMARSGIGNFTISDFDRFEPVNINRQYGATTGSFGKSKLEIMKDQALLVNPYINIRTFPEGLLKENVDSFLDGVDIVLDGLDFFCFDIRRELFKRAREKGIHVITAGPMGFSAALLIFSPNQGMGFDEYFNISDGMTPEDKILSFALGLAPRATHIKYMDFSQVDLAQRSGPSLNVACQICSGMAGTEAIRIILGRRGLKPVPHYFQFDPYLMKLRKGTLFWGNRNPVQRIKIRFVKRMLASKKGGGKPVPPKLPENFTVQGDIVPEEVIEYLIRAGIQAPSGDNAQPWRFHSERSRITILADEDADRSFFNVNQIASMISCGAAIENMKIAASRFGLTSEIEYFSEESGTGANLCFKSGQIRPDPLHDYTWKRHTNRTMYRKESFPESVIDLCEKTVSSYQGVKLFTVTEKKDIAKLAKIVFSVDRIRTEHQGLHEHLMKMIRFDSSEEADKKDGLPLKNLQAGMAGEIFLKATRPWRMMDLSNKAGLGRMVALHSYQGIRNSSAVMLIAAGGMAPEDFLTGGRTLERVWLELTRLGYHIQPMTAVTLFFMRLCLRGKADFMPSHIKLLESVEDKYYDIFKGLEKGMGQIMLFRVGRGSEIRHFTRRKNIQAFYNV